MKWCWIVLIVVAVALIGYFVATKMKKKPSGSTASSPAATPVVVSVASGQGSALAPAM